MPTTKCHPHRLEMQESLPPPPSSIRKGNKRTFSFNFSPPFQCLPVFKVNNGERWTVHTKKLRIRRRLKHSSLFFTWKLLFEQPKDLQQLLIYSLLQPYRRTQTRSLTGKGRSKEFLSSSLTKNNPFNKLSRKATFLLWNNVGGRYFTSREKNLNVKTFRTFEMKRTVQNQY